MAIEIALLAVCGVLVSAVIWRLNRALRVLGEVQGEVNALRDLVSRVFLMQLNCKTENEPSSLGAAPPPPFDPAAKNAVREDDATQLELETADIDESAEIDTTAEIDDIGELCAKLITLVPPKEAEPLLGPVRSPSEARERRLIPRHQTSKIGRILHHGRPDHVCTVSNTSPAGALLLVANAYGLPEQFDLHVDGYSRSCTARWRRLDRIGVKFKSIAAA